MNAPFVHDAATGPCIHIDRWSAAPECIPDLLKQLAPDGGFVHDQMVAF